MPLAPCTGVAPTAAVSGMDVAWQALHLPLRKPATMIQLLSVNVGRIQPLQARGREVRSAFCRAACEGAVSLTTLGLQGDEHADLAVHGGLTKAVYAYPSEHYAWWQARRCAEGVAPADEVLPPGALGENLTLAGVLENEVWIGDELHGADGALVVTMPRQPCFKFNAVMGYAEAARHLLLQGCSGFYLSVKTPGTLRAGETLKLVAGPREVSVETALGALRVQWRLKEPA